jgi:hypothetical protein
VTKYQRKQLKGGGINFGSWFSPWSVGSFVSWQWETEDHGSEHVVEKQLIVDRKQRRQEEGARDMVEPPTTPGSNLLPPARPYLLKFLVPPKISLPAEHQGFNT